MILYHGSYMEVQQPDLKHSRQAVDFGRGFYTTPLYEQAKKWCERFTKQGKCAFISKYTFDETKLEEFKVLKFDDYSEEWLEFVLNCRRKIDTSSYDVVIGGVANDKVFNTVELYFDNLIDKKEAIQRLKYEKPNLQICFRSEKVIKSGLDFEGSERL